jgi:hypothetical protein
MRRALPLLAAAALACGTIDADELAPIAGYQDWHRIDFAGPLPGHGESYRILYVNDVGRSYPGSGRYLEGTVLVKEIRRLDGDAPGDLRYTAIMRKVGDAPVSATVEGGWVFSYLGGSDERRFSSCWSGCHAQAPFDGAWYAYGE